MSTLKELVESVINSSSLSSASIECVREILRYPIDYDKVGIEFSVDDQKQFHSVSLYRLLRFFLLTFDKDSSPHHLELLEWAARFSKADVVFQFLSDQCSLKHDEKISKTLTSLFEKFLFQFARIIDLLKEWEASLEDGPGLKAIENYARLLANVPFRCANLVQGQYHTRLLDRSQFVHQVMSTFTSNSSPNFTVLHGAIVTQLVLCGFGEECATFLLEESAKHAHVDSHQEFLWSRLICHIQSRALESLLLSVFHRSKHPHLVAILISDFITSSEAIHQEEWIRLFRRYLFTRYFPNGWLLRNMFGSLCEVLTNCCSEGSSTNLYNLVNERLGFPLLRLWADATAIQRTSIDQRVYVSQALASWITCFCNPVASRWSLEIPHAMMLPDVLSGISNHLSSPRAEVRAMGMIIGEWLMGLVELPSDSKPVEQLKFTYKDTEETEKIKPFLTALDAFVPEPNNARPPLIPPEQPINELPTEHHPTSLSDLDSDDDPDDAPPPLVALPQRPRLKKALPSVLAGMRRPRYLRECLDGMLIAKQEDSRISQLCFASAPDLIRLHPQSARELCTELARALLHVESPACPDESKLMSDRHAALVALGTVAPKECARYLTNEFFQPTCSLAQRQNIVSAITDIACELSRGTSIAPPPSRASSTIMTLKLESQTRRFCSPSVPKPQTYNQFSSVAGEFFFPLLRSLPQLHSCSEHGIFAHQDAGLLSSLIACLATVYACSHGSSVQTRMALELLDLLPLLYRHSEPAVRQAVLLAMGTVIVSTPNGILSADPQLFLGASSGLQLVAHTLDASVSNDIPLWLKRCSVNDEDSECRLLASAGLTALCNRVKDLTIS